jgi:hypothetical protein
MTLNASGNLSLGNTNDTYKLDVSGTGRFTLDTNKSITTYVAPSTWSGISDYVTGGVGVAFSRPNDGVLANAIFTFNGAGDNNFAISARSSFIVATGGGLGGSTQALKITDTGAATFSSSVTATGALSTYGQLRLEPSAFGSIVVGSRSSQTDFQLYNTGNIFRIYNGSSDALTVNTSGNVGIGTTSPSGKFQVVLPAYLSEDTDSQQAIFGSGTSGYGVRIGYNESNNIGYINSLKPGVAWSNLQIQANNIIFAPVATERMRITSGGDVGIGTTSPTNRLQVNVSSNDTGGFIDASYPLYLRNTSTTANSYVGIYFGGGFGVGATIETQFISPSTSSEGILKFATRNSSGTIAERMRITSGGNVEIATGSIKTGEPDTGWGRAAIKIGQRQSGEAFSSGGYLPVNVDGTVYYINLYSSTP